MRHSHNVHPVSITHERLAPLTTRKSDGTLLLRSDLPPVDIQQRWSPKKKALVIEAVRGGVISLEEVFARYVITREEYDGWVKKYESAGRKGLLVTQRFDEELCASALTFKYCDVVLNTTLKTVRVNGRNVHVSQKEYEVLEFLCLRKGQVISREMIVQHLYAPEDVPSSDIVDVYVHKLRQKLCNAGVTRANIMSVYGRGYIVASDEVSR